MKKFLAFQLLLWVSLHVLAAPTFTTKNVPVNRGGQTRGSLLLWQLVSIADITF